MQSPFIQIIPVLTPEQVETVNNAIEASDYERFKNTVFSGETTNVNHSIRTSSGFTLREDDEAAKILGTGMNRALLVYRDELFAKNPVYTHSLVAGAPGTSSHREGIQILEYQPGEHYRFHYDMHWDSHVPEYHRTISVVLYLNDEFEGGGTEFVDETYKPKAGEALIFPSHWTFPHSGQSVKSGMKRVAVTWYYVYPTPVSPAEQ